MEVNTAESSSDSAKNGVGPAAKLKQLVARKRESLKTEQEEKKTLEDNSRESWSGLRISDRCVRQEKWDQSMRGKTLISFSSMSAADPIGRDQVLIGVMISDAIGPKLGPDGKEYAEWILTDLDSKCPQQITLVLVGRAMDHWSHKDGLGRKLAKAGAIIAVLNPSMTGRAKAIRVSFESQLLKLGMCPSLALCKAKVADGLECREPFDSESGCQYCARHESMSHGERQQLSSRSSATRATARTHAISQQVASTSRSRPIASPLAAVADSRPIGVILTSLQRAESALDAGIASGKSAEILRILRDLERLQVDGVTLRHCMLYDKLGSLVQGQDAVASAAKLLRRSWRTVMDAAEMGIQSSKRQRLG